MTQAITYTTHDGSMSFPLCFEQGGIDSLLSDSYDFALTESRDRSFASWRRASKEIPIEIVAIGYEDRATIDEALHYDADTDSYGVIDANGYELMCRMSQIAWSDWERSRNMAKAAVSLVSPDGVWRRRSVIHLTRQSGDVVSTSGIDYPHDYGFDYQLDSAMGEMISVDSKGGCLAKITFFGPCSSPYVKIGDNVYGVDAPIQAGERIVIDPLGTHKEGESVYMVGTWGERTNLFACRKRGVPGGGSYPFERIPYGTHAATWPQSYGVDVELIEERGAPRWS